MSLRSQDGAHLTGVPELSTLNLKTMGAIFNLPIENIILSGESI